MCVFAENYLVHCALCAKSGVHSFTLQFIFLECFFCYVILFKFKLAGKFMCVFIENTEKNI